MIDLEITRENTMDIMRARRTRWRIENETFNTLKNQGDNLMMLTFLIDQACQMRCWLFKEACKKIEAQRRLWERILGIFHEFSVDSMETIYRAIAFGFERVKLVIAENNIGTVDLFLAQIRLVTVSA